MDSYMQSILTGLEGAGGITEVCVLSLQNFDLVVWWDLGSAYMWGGVGQRMARG